MTQHETGHECDLFLLTSHHPYAATRALAEFASRGRRNVDGWGIGSYVDGQARVLRSADAAFPPSSVSTAQLSREFAIAIQAVTSETILGHLRLTSSGETRVENNHPFMLPFLGYQWLLIHNGTGRRNLIPHEDRLLLDSTNDTARVFEFLRQHMIEYYLSSPKRSLIEAARSAFNSLLAADPDGSFNLILSNGYLSFAFVHWRRFYLLNRSKETGHVALLSTVKLTDSEDWVRFEPSDRNAKMLVFCGHSLILNSDIPR